MRVFVLFALLVVAALCAGQSKPALKGFDPVLLVEGKEVKGNEAHSVTKGRLKYIFSSAETKARFESEPDKYGIQFGGQCVLSQEMEGDDSLYFVWKNKIYIGAMKHCIDLFREKPELFIDASGARIIPEDNRRTVAILVFDGVQTIDYAGPLETFAQGGMRPFTVAATLDPINTSHMTLVTPNHTFENAPKASIIVIPGGGIKLRDERIINWIKKSAAEADYVLSVCNGAFYLAKAGLLDGMKATTFYGMIDDLKAAAPKATVVEDQRFCDNGKIITTAGLSSGIDGALHVIEKINGFGAAQSAALNMEYDWKPDSGYARAGLADKPLREMLGINGFDVPMDKVRSWTVLKQSGDSKWWQKEWETQISITQEELMKLLDAKMAASWTRTGGDLKSESKWKFTSDKKDYTATCTVKEASANKYLITLRLVRI